MRAPFEDHAVQIGLDKGIERRLDDGLRHLLAVDQRLVGTLLFGHVADERDRPTQCTGRVPQRTCRRRDGLPDTGPLGLDDELHVVDILAMQRAGHGKSSGSARVTPSARKYLNGFDRVVIERSTPMSRLAAALAITILPFASITRRGSLMLCTVCSNSA